MSVKVGEVGKLLIIGSGGFDLSGNTELRVVLKKPDGTTTVTKLKADGVSAPATPITVPVDGVDTTFEANEYWQYPTESGVLDIDGRWQIHGEYVDATPKDFCGDSSLFDVLPCG